jgi:hypothetical protein
MASRWALAGVGLTILGSCLGALSACKKTPTPEPVDAQRVIATDAPPARPNDASVLMLAPPAPDPTLLKPGLARPYLIPNPALDADTARGYDALARGDLMGALTAFNAAVALDPWADDPRLGLATVYTKAGNVPAAAQELQGPLFHDLVEINQRLEHDPRLAALQDPALLTAISGEKDQAGAASALATNGALFFVAPPLSASSGNEAAPTPMGQGGEAWAYDRTDGRYLQLTSTGGQVAGALASPDGRLLAYVTITASHDPSGAAGPIIDKATVAVVTLGTFGVSPALPLDGPLRDVAVGFVPGAQTLRLREDGMDDAGNLTTVRGTSAVPALTLQPNDAGTDQGARMLVVRADGTAIDEGSGNGGLSDVAVGIDGQSLTLTGGMAITVGEAVDPMSMVWSPHHLRLMFRSAFSACDDSASTDLFVVDAATGGLTKVASGHAFLQSSWIDDVNVLYETGLGSSSGVRLVPVDGHPGGLDLDVRGGGGVFGIPRAPSCGA